MDKKDTKIDDAQTAAIFAAFSIIAFSAVYWTVQIQGVREMLEMAYG